VDVGLGDGGINPNPLAVLDALILGIPYKYPVDLLPRLGRNPLDVASQRRLPRNLLWTRKATKPPIRIRVGQVEGEI